MYLCDRILEDSSMVLEMATDVAIFVLRQERVHHKKMSARTKREVQRRIKRVTGQRRV